MDIFVVCLSIIGLLFASIGIALLSAALFCKIGRPIKAGVFCVILGAIIIAFALRFYITQGQIF